MDTCWLRLLTSRTVATAASRGLHRIVVRLGPCSLHANNEQICFFAVDELGYLEVESQVLNSLCQTLLGS